MLQTSLLFFRVWQCGGSLATVLCLDAQRSEDSLRLNRTLILVWHSFTLQFSGFSSSVLELLRSHYSLRACKRKDWTLYYCVLFQCFLLHYPVGTRLYYHPLYFTWLRLHKWKWSEIADLIYTDILKICLPGNARFHVILYLDITMSLKWIEKKLIKKSQDSILEKQFRIVLTVFLLMHMDDGGGNAALYYPILY